MSGSAASLLRRAGELIALEPPVDVEQLARELGVSEIRRVPMVEDGRLEPCPGGARVLLRLGNGKARERFTLAHELAHLMLAEGGGELATRRRDGAWDREERLCDRFAAELLLPRVWLRRRQTEQEDLATLKGIAGEAEVSLSAALIALQESGRWGKALLRWRRASPARWALVSVVGVPPTLRRSLRSNDAASQALSRLSPGATHHVEDLPLSAQGSTVAATGEIDARATSRIGLMQVRECDASGERERSQ